jgi:hypothetical protein
MAVVPNNLAAVKFLERFAPDGGWVLTAIKLDRTGIDTATFGPSTKGDLKTWLEKHNGVDNIYFHVNPTKTVLTKKATREDISAVRWLHVDVDPIAGRDLATERDRITQMFTQKLPKNVPPPTCIIFSGGGFQAFWRLEEPIPIDGDLTKAENAALYNMQLEQVFGGDNCHNIDRIMRLPGTINIPDARKKKKGRSPELAAVIEFNDHVYSLKKFHRSGGTQMPEDADSGLGTSGRQVNVRIDENNIRRIDDVSELDEWSVTNRYKIIMVQGKHPDEPKQGDNSRSIWLFDFVCGLCRAGVPDDVIYGILTDKSWGIAESVLESKNPKKYALRQIQRGREHSIDPLLEQYNTKFAIIENLGGKCLVVRYDHNFEEDRDELSLQDFSNFRNARSGEFVEEGEKLIPAGKWWLEHKNHRKFERMVFSPSVVTPSNVLNLWTGFAVESRQGDCGLYLDHILTNICSGNQLHYDYLINWMARTVQQPNTQGEVAVVMRGGRGTGKSFFANAFGHLFGRHSMAVSSSSHLTGNFNGHTADLIVLFADEAFYANDKKHQSVLKTMITEPRRPIERKGVDVETVRNYLHLIIASNDDHVVPAGMDERRFFVLDIAATHQRDTKYFAAIKKQLDNGGYSALLHFLQTRDLTDWDVRKVPQTKALIDQKLASMDAFMQWWSDNLHNSKLHPKGWPDAIYFVELEEKFHVWCKELQKSNYDRPNGTGFAKRLSQVIPDYESRRFKETRGKRWTVIKLPTQTECLDHFMKIVGDLPAEELPDYTVTEETSAF